MNSHAPKFKIRLGLFILVGLTLFTAAVFLIGRQKNLFNPVFRLTTTFHNISGLQVGSNIRFSGINVGTVDNINLINDTTVQVGLLIDKSVQRFIRSDCEAGVGSSGIIGDRILTITQGSSGSPMAEDGQAIGSKEPVETDAILANLKTTADNAVILSDLLAKIVGKVNTGKGTLGRFIQDTTMAENINQTLVNLRKSSQGLNENMTALKQNFFFKGYFEKQAEEEKRLLEEKADSSKTRE